MPKIFIYKSKYLKTTIHIQFGRKGIQCLEFKSLTTIKDQAKGPHTFKWAKVLDNYFYKHKAFSKFKMELKGTDLQLKVWQELCKIPMGTVISYAELAKRVGNPKAVRAVGTAVGKNPIPLLIPCHRVIKSNGEIGNYTGGVKIKEKLLLLEL